MLLAGNTVSTKWPPSMAAYDTALPWIRSCENFRIDGKEHVIALAAVRVAVLSTVVRPPVPVVHLNNVALAVRRVLAPTMPHIATVARKQGQWYRRIVSAPNIGLPPPAY